MHITKNMKSGYQGKPDAMREKGEQMLNHPGSAPDVIYSKSCAEKSKIRPYKKGGLVKGDKSYDMTAVEKMEDRVRTGASKKDKRGCQKFAMGGVAKIRHGEATDQGLPIKFKKKSVKEFL